MIKIYHHNQDKEVKMYSVIIEGKCLEKAISYKAKEKSKGRQKTENKGHRRARRFIK